MRLIDAEAFRIDIARMCVKRCHLYENDDVFPNCGECVANFIYEMLKKAPTIEAKPVVHAHWELFGKNGTDTDYGCTNCGYTFTTSGNYPQIAHYCPYCGAQMDEEAN